MENLQNISYQFKICVTLGEYTQAIFYLEKLMNFIEEYSYEEIEILNRLTNELLGKDTRLLEQIITRHSDTNEDLKYHNQIVLEKYSGYVHNEVLDYVERLLSAMMRIKMRLKEAKSLGLACKIIGKLNAFMGVYCNRNLSEYLESALISYKEAVNIAIRDMGVYDHLRLRLCLSYCKFIARTMKDYYRSILFCMNIIEEVHRGMSEKGNEESNNSNGNIEMMLGKYKRFYESNREQYNKTVALYFP